jgi:hypothetical protein
VVRDGDINEDVSEDGDNNENENENEHGRKKKTGNLNG